MSEINTFCFETENVQYERTDTFLSAFRHSSKFPFFNLGNRLQHIQLIPYFNFEMQIKHHFVTKSYIIPAY